jgi:hypothetical protein
MATQPHWTRSHLYKILTDRSYIGDVKYQGNWYPGVHEPPIDKPTWNRVRVLLGGRQGLSVPRDDLCGLAGDLRAPRQPDHRRGENQDDQARG